MGVWGDAFNFIKKPAIGLLTGGPAGAAAGLASNFLGGSEEEQGGGGNRLLNILQTAAGIGLGTKGLIDSRKASKRRNELNQERLEVARRILEGTEGIRSATNQAIESRVRGGVLPPPNLMGLQDTANPFRSRFSFDAGQPTEPSGPARPPARPPRSRRRRRRNGGGEDEDDGE